VLVLLKVCKIGKVLVRSKIIVERVQGHAPRTVCWRLPEGTRPVSLRNAAAGGRDAPSEVPGDNTVSPVWAPNRL